MKTLSRFSFFLFLFLPFFTAAQSDSLLRNGIQVSLLTCGAGAEIYSVFGHTAVRIVDSAKETDIVYNYGTFDGYDEHFEQKFMQGKLLYYLSEDRYDEFIELYGMDGRWVEEQVLNLSPQQKQRIQLYLEENLLPENRAYKYDFFFDNCATRIRDIFTQTQGEGFRYPNVLPEGKPLSFRDIINRYLADNAWERFGINILLGSRIDQKMSNAQIMFLPDYLRDGVAGATVDGHRFAQESRKIVEGEQALVQNDFSLPLVLYGLLVLLCSGLFIPRLKVLGNILSVFILLTTGLLGSLIVFMWLGTDHQACAANFNLLWALPTNLLFVFRRKQYKYAALAIMLIFVMLIMHLLQIQCLLLPEMVPVLLMLLLIYSTGYKKYKLNAEERNKA